MSGIDDIGSRLRMARIAAGFKTAKAFCKANGICPSTYSLHETNKRTLKLDVAGKYAKLLKVDVVWLLMGRKSYDIREEDEDGNSLSEISAGMNNVGVKKSKKSPPVKEFQLSNQPIVQNFLRTMPTGFTVYPPLFCKIVMEIYKLIQEIDIKICLDELTQRAIEMYESIIMSAGRRNEQFSMISSAISSLKQQLEKK